jgi:hypothetical protein
MSSKPARINRAGSIHFGDARLSIWEEGITDARNAGGFKGAQAWELSFKREVFSRIVQTLNRIGWKLKVSTEHQRLYGRSFAENFRECAKGDLRGELRISGRTISLEMWQGVNTPTRPDHGGRYEPNKEACAPYLLRLEMDRTRNRIRQYLLNVLTGYEFSPEKIASPSPDPLAYFNSTWDSAYERSRGIHRFDRGADGWPSDKAIECWSRLDKDGAQLRSADVRWLYGRSGRLLRGRVYGGINGMWMFVYGPGKRDYTHEPAGYFFTYKPGLTPRKLVSAYQREQRLKQELEAAVKAMDFQRAHTLKGILFPAGRKTTSQKPAPQEVATA